MHEVGNLVQEIDLGFGAQKTASITEAFNEIVTTDTHCCIQGGASCGKTTLARLLSHEIWQRKESVTVLLASRHLTDEFRDTFIEYMLEQPDAESGKVNSKSHTDTAEDCALEGLNFMTLNALAFRILSTFPADSSESQSEAVSLLSGAEEEMILKDAVNAIENQPSEHQRIFSTHAALTELRDICATCTQHSITPERLSELALLFERPLWIDVAKIYATYTSMLKKLRKVDSNLMVQSAIEALRDFKQNVANIPNVLIIDDAQELNMLQLGFVKQLASLGTRCVFIGDPKQTVNTFRGAIGGFAHVLKQPPLSDTFSSLKTLSLQTAKFTKPSIIKMASRYDCEQDVYQKIRLLTLREKRAYDDIAVIARNHGVLNSIRKTLSAHNIPTVFSTSYIPIWRETIYQQLKTKVLEILGNDSSKSTNKPAELIWEAWDGMQLAKRLQDDVILERNAASSARILDVVTFLLEQASAFAGDVQEFFAQLERQNIAPDNIFAPQNSNGVHLLTPATSNGRHFQHVFVLEVNDRVWPNLKLRGQVFDYRLLADIETKRIDNITQINRTAERKEVRASELQLFYIALTRSKNTIVYCFEDDETTSSTFLYPMADDLTIEQFKSIPLTIAELAKKARYELVKYEIGGKTGRESDSKTNDTEDDVNATDTNVHVASVQDYYSILKILESTGSNLADSTNWYYSNKPSVLPHSPPKAIYMSPSKLENFVKCPLMWFLNENATNTVSNDFANVGSAVHKCAEVVSELVSEHVEFDETSVQNNDVRTIVVSDTDPTYVEMVKYLRIYMQGADFAKASALDLRVFETRVKFLLKRVIAYYDWFHKNTISMTQSQVAINVEQKLECQIGVVEIDGVEIPVHLRGSVDRIEITQENIRIVDWKTGKTPWKPDISDDVGILEQHNLQMYAYEMLVQEHYPDSHIEETSLVYLGKSPNQDKELKIYPPFSESMCLTNATDFGVNGEITAALLGAIRSFYTSDTIQARQSTKTCGFCSFKNVCPTQEISAKIGDDT